MHTCECMHACTHTHIYPIKVITITTYAQLLVHYGKRTSYSVEI